MSRLLKPILETVYTLLYNQFAWSYDLVAWVVSAGHWNEWVSTALPDLSGSRILELGFGPGHLQRALNGKNKNIFGLDASWSMNKIAYRNITNAGFESKCAYGYAQNLPFKNRCFDHLVATFPADYIFSLQLAQEAWRVLSQRGTFVIIPAAMPLPKSPRAFLGYSLHHLSEQSQQQLESSLHHFVDAGFSISIQRVLLEHSIVLKIIAQKTA